MSKAINTGGPAFPVNEEALMRNLQGMTLRDYFAAKVVQARMTAFCALETHHGWSNDEIAKDAYSIADAMLKVREQT